MREATPGLKRIVGAAAASAKDTRLIETLYKTKVPETSVYAGAHFELTIREETIDGRLVYFVYETECRWIEAAKYTVRVQYTLSPRGGFPTIEEAHERYKLQRTTRARSGFVHSYAPSYDAEKHRRYARIEVAAETTVMAVMSNDPLQPQGKISASRKTTSLDIASASKGDL
jgi:hypothetical protein